MPNELKLLALHVNQDNDKNWFVSAIIQTEHGPETRVVFRSMNQRPIFDIYNGTLWWEPKQE